MALNPLAALYVSEIATPRSRVAYRISQTSHKYLARFFALPFKGLGMTILDSSYGRGIFKETSPRSRSPRLSTLGWVPFYVSEDESFLGFLRYGSAGQTIVARGPQSYAVG